MVHKFISTYVNSLFFFGFVKDTIHTVFTLDYTTTLSGRKQFDYWIRINWVNGRLLPRALKKNYVI